MTQYQYPFHSPTVSSVRDQPPTPTPPPCATNNGRTFKLYEFNGAFGRDAHPFVFVQLESNAAPFHVFESALHRREDGREPITWSARVYTDTDLGNIQESCLEILRGFEGTNDAVEFVAVLDSSCWCRAGGTGDVRIPFHRSHSTEVCIRPRLVGFVQDLMIKEIDTSPSCSHSVSSFHN